MAWEGLHLFWKQILLGCYAVLAVLRGVVMLLRPRMVLDIFRKTGQRIVAGSFRLVGRTMPRMDPAQQILVVRILGGLSLLGAVALLWWVVK